MRATYTCRKLSVHDFAADVKVFGESDKCNAFVTLELEVGTDKIELFLPPHAYHRAKSIANLWEQLIDHAPAFQRVPETGGVS